MAALVLTLNQIRFCEVHGCQPQIVWGPFPACKYAGVRFPGRTPFYDAARGHNAFHYYFAPICDAGKPVQTMSPALSCEQREAIHRVLPWAIRTYYYDSGASAGVKRTAGAFNDTFDEAWYKAQRTEGARLVRAYLRLQPHVTARLAPLEADLLGIGRAGLRARVLKKRGPVLGVHLRGTDKGKYLHTAGSGQSIGPAAYEPYVHAFLSHHGPNASVFVATDSPSYLNAALRTCAIPTLEPAGKPKCSDPGRNVLLIHRLRSISFMCGSPCPQGQLAVCASDRMCYGTRATWHLLADSQPRETITGKAKKCCSMRSCCLAATFCCIPLLVLRRWPSIGAHTCMITLCTCSTHEVASRPHGCPPSQVRRT